ncbi:hypothetical protein EJ05DRAFT_497040 [Pseudovirgaria hyperparasitica]|uniref:Uncharacterized protein n=1 Tax=Pseudovirgaria hyperparasitica TaxID=470096 RepID=A0A6A6WH91_9PEZI|nr:uncharacterized protein EJ05DRAFT_497040 [Pseudovirgaria hyperparasitica]KAF2762173.1 hypothetical protein EJ05DRAFT_497040 [Pseudovirgaria hyperparasitica]
MAPTESSILTNFLIPPAPLHQVLSLDDFTALFPRKYHSSPQIELIYREFQHQRAIDTDDVKRNIASEVKRGEKYQREVIRTRRKQDAQAAEGVDMADIRMEAQLFGQSQHRPSNKAHTPVTLQAALDSACNDVEAEITALEAEAASKLQKIQGIIGGLSDLRYGKFAQPAGSDADLSQDTEENLQRLKKLCAESSKG